jgi:hypothetical protein
MMDKISIGVIGFVVIQTVGVIWWINNKVAQHEKCADEIPKIYWKIKGMLEEINQFEEKCYGR